MSTYYEESKTDGWAIVAGILLVVVGIIAIGAPLASAAAAAFVLPIALLVKGVAELVSLTRAPSAGAIAWRLIVGVLAIIAGFWLLFQPALAIAALPVVLIAYLIAEGVVRIVVSFSPDVPGRAWVAVSGVISILLGVLLWVEPFATTLVLIGIYIGIDVLFAGLALIMAGFAARRSFPGGVRAV